jgi:hypothetical protein
VLAASTLILRGAPIGKRCSSGLLEVLPAVGAQMLLSACGTSEESDRANSARNGRAQQMLNRQAEAARLVCRAPRGMGQRMWGMCGGACHGARQAKARNGETQRRRSSESARERQPRDGAAQRRGGGEERDRERERDRRCGGDDLRQRNAALVVVVRCQGARRVRGESVAEASTRRAAAARAAAPAPAPLRCSIRWAASRQRPCPPASMLRRVCVCCAAAASRTRRRWRPPRSSLAGPHSCRGAATQPGQRKTNANARRPSEREGRPSRGLLHLVRQEPAQRRFDRAESGQKRRRRLAQRGRCCAVLPLELPLLLHAEQSAAAASAPTSSRPAASAVPAGHQRAPAAAAQPDASEAERAFARFPPWRAALPDARA